VSEPLGKPARQGAPWWPAMLLCAFSVGLTALATFAMNEALASSLRDASGRISTPALVGLVLGASMFSTLTAGLGLWWLMRRQSTSPWGRPRLMPREQAVEDMRHMSPYLGQLKTCLDQAMHASEEGAILVIEKMNTIHQVSIEQFERIRTTETQGQALTQIMNDKAMVDTQLGAILQMFVENQEAEVEANLTRLHRLQEVKDLGSMVEVIATVARQTNLMSINAAIEAARAGDSGRSFAVLATEIRELSNRTSAVAVDIGQRIEAATQGIDKELSRVTEASNRQTTTGNMRKVISDIAEMQQRFSDSMAHLRLPEVIEEIRSGHQAIAERLSDALGDLQSQDVAKQRIALVHQSLGDLDGHLQTMADQLLDQPWQPDAIMSVEERLQALIEEAKATTPSPHSVGNSYQSAGTHKVELF
jgi:methyl-accepting chemotaxis protein